MKAFTEVKLRRLPLSATVMAICGATATMPSFAQQTGETRVLGLEEIVVTAQRRQESLQDVPISVVALSAEALADRGILDTQALPEIVPSVQYVSSGPSSIFFVRGVGNSNAGVGEEGANAFYVDGVYMPDLFQAAMKFNNIERVEVLKGPQGTLFGRNSSGGLVHMITREPGQETVADFKVGYANYDTTTTQAYLAGPLADTLAADIAISTSNQSDGWGKNLTTGSDVGKSWHWGVRSKAVWTPTDTAKLTFAGEYTKLSDDTFNLRHIAQGALGLSPQPGVLPPVEPPPGDGFNTTTDYPNHTKMRLYGGSLTAEFDLDWATLTSISALRDMANDSAVDPDNGPYPLIGISLDIETSSYQQEFRLASSETEPLSWQGGVFYLHSTAQVDPQVTEGLILLGQSGGMVAGTNDFVKQTTESIASFGEITYALTPSTRVTTGLRYTHDKSSLSGVQVPIPGPAAPGPLPENTRRDSTTDKEMTYRLALRQEITENINIYASYNRGFKSGLYSLNAYPWNPVKPQTIDAFEVGLKSTLLDNRLRLNLAAFHYQIDDYQVRAVTGFGQQTLLNAASVDVDGFEIEFEAVPLDGLSLFGSATYLKSEFASFPNAPTVAPNPPFVGGGANLVASAKGNDTPLAPRFAGSLGGSYTMPAGPAGEVRLSANYSYNDGYYFEPDNRMKQPSYSLVNASVAYNAYRNWGVELWGRNLTDKRHYIQKSGSALGDTAVRAAPRTYGINLSYSF